MKAQIRVYDESGDRRVTVEVRRMDQIDYKRQGRAGSILGLVDVIGDKRITMQIMEGGAGRFSVPITSRNFLALWRDGRRVNS